MLDRLDHLFLLQKRIQLLFYDPAALSEVERAQESKELCIALLREVGEFLDGVPYSKPWKKNYPPLDRDNLVLELVDMAHFLIELCLLWGVSPEELYLRYLAKHQENLDRYNEGY